MNDERTGDIDELLAALQDIEQDVLSRARAFVGAGQAYVRDNPWQAIGAAAVIGFALGALLSRRPRQDA